MSLLITLVVYLLILGVVYWIITLLPLPAPLPLILQIVFAILVLVVLVDLLTGGSIGLPRLR